MFTTDIVGSNDLVLKLSLEISKNDFVSRMEFQNDKEREKCLLYLDLKGVAYHTVLANYIELDGKGKIRYAKVQNMYIYDKRVRYILYKYLSALEEGIRGFISNKYSDNLENIKKLSRIIHRNITEGSSLSKELEDLVFSKLLNLAKKLPINERVELFGQTEKLKENLLAVKQLRNAVSHHRMLFVFEDYYECFFKDGKSGRSLMDNILNLRQLLNPYYRVFFNEEINSSSLDIEDTNFAYTLPNKAIINLKNADDC